MELEEVRFSESAILQIVMRPVIQVLGVRKTYGPMVAVDEVSLLDIENPKSITPVANSLAKQHPELNVLINNAGIMKVDNVQDGSEGERYDVRNYWNHWQRWRQHSA